MAIIKGLLGTAALVSMIIFMLTDNEYIEKHALNFALVSSMWFAILVALFFLRGV